MVQLTHLVLPLMLASAALAMPVDTTLAPEIGTVEANAGSFDTPLQDPSSIAVGSDDTDNIDKRQPMYIGPFHKPRPSRCAPRDWGCLLSQPLIGRSPKVTTSNAVNNDLDHAPRSFSNMFGLHRPGCMLRMGACNSPKKVPNQKLDQRGIKLNIMCVLFRKGCSTPGPQKRTTLWSLLKDFDPRICAGINGCGRPREKRPSANKRNPAALSIFQTARCHLFRYGCNNGRSIDVAAESPVDNTAAASEMPVDDVLDTIKNLVAARNAEAAVIENPVEEVSESASAEE